MPSFKHPATRKHLAFLLRAALCVGMWILLTELTQAAEIHHHSFAEEIIHILGLNLYSVMLTLWVFILGACIGSFLNVVIYRMPAGIALSHPDSHCPTCETELTARDNIPILGWLILRGRCRYCQNRISLRYPIIEFSAGLLFLTLLVMETGTGAANLPLLVPIPVYGAAFSSIFQDGHWELVGWFAAHGIYLTLVLAICMIGFDGHVPPRRLVLTGVVAGLIGGLFWPELRPVHVLHPMPEWLAGFRSFDVVLPQWLAGRNSPMGISLVGIPDGLAGLASGLLTGQLAVLALSRCRSLTMTVKSVFVLSGVIGGWQMTWPILAIMLVSIGVLKLFQAETQQKSLPLILAGTCIVLILAWSQLLNGIVLISSSGWCWTAAAAWIDWVVTNGVLTLLAVILSRIPLHQDASP